MTVVKETRQIFDLRDIKALRLHCAHCGGEAVQAVSTTEVPKQCPTCREEWEPGLPNGNRSENWQLVHTMKRLLKVDTPRMTIRFEIAGDAKE